MSALTPGHDGQEWPVDIWYDTAAGYCVVLTPMTDDGIRLLTALFGPPLSGSYDTDMDYAFPQESLSTLLDAADESGITIEEA